MYLLKATLLANLLLFAYCSYSQVAINRNGADPDPSAALDIQSNNKGLLIPRMSTAEIGAIVSPAKGLLVFDTDKNAWYINLGTGATPEWEKITIASKIQDDDGDTRILTDENDDDDVIRFQVDGKEMMSLKENSSGYNQQINLPNNRDNVLIGDGAGDTIGFGGYRNIALGSQALITNQNYDDNITIGYHALKNATGPISAVAIGSNVLKSSISSNHDVVIGADAAQNVSGITGSVIMGGEALSTLASSCNSNTIIGYQAAKNTTSLSPGNTAIGHASMINASGGSNTAVGHSSLQDAYRFRKCSRQPYNYRV